MKQRIEREPLTTKKVSLASSSLFSARCNEHGGYGCGKDTAIRLALRGRPEIENERKAYR